MPWTAIESGIHEVINQTKAMGKAAMEMLGSIKIQLLLLITLQARDFKVKREQWPLKLGVEIRQMLTKRNGREITSKNSGV